MFIPVLLGIVTVLSVFFALKKRKPILFAVPLASVLAVAFVKIAMVPMPFWDTIQFIFDLRG